MTSSIDNADELEKGLEALFTAGINVRVEKLSPEDFARMALEEVKSLTTKLATMTRERNHFQGETLRLLSENAGLSSENAELRARLVAARAAGERI